MTELRFPDPPLADAVIRLRPWSERDVVDGHRTTRDPLVLHHTHVPARQTLEDLRSWVCNRERERLAGRELAFAIAGVDDDAFLGCVSLLRFEWEDRRAEVGYYLAPWARGRGVMTRAVHMLSRWALAEVPLARLALIADHDNAPSQAVAERCGFRREGVLRSFEERKGRRVDVVVFSLLPSDL